MSYSEPVILNVDDNEGARYAKTRTLQLAGFEVVEAATGGEALAQLQRRLPDLVLLDVKLPDMSGIEVCRRIRNDPAIASVVILQTSASFIGTEDKIRGLDGGADNYLVVPIEPEELVANVRALLRLAHTQRELRDSEERFRQMAENIGDVFWIFTPQPPQLLYVSPAYAALWGVDPARLYDDFDGWLECVHDDDRARVEQAFAQLLLNNPYEMEFRVVRPDGSECWVRDRAFAVRSNGDDFYRVARISQDVTQRRAAEQKLREADQRKDEFLATLAHELRNPLGPIRNAIELMRLSETSEDMQRNAREMISRQIDHLVRLVDDLLDVSRITQGKITLQLARVELKAFIAAAREIVQPLSDKRRHQLTITLPEQEVWLLGDDVRLSQIVENLLHNAVKYTPPGGAIELEASVQDERLLIVVTDNGIGISAHDLDRIFDLFAQSNHAPDRAQDGLGIGLSLVRSLVQLHGGRIEASSPGIGRGSRFVVSLPILASEARPTPSTRSPAAVDAAAEGALRIQLVDDSIDATAMLALLLRRLGHTVEVAHDGPAALVLAQQFDPQVVLLDIGLPGMDGYEVASALRSQPGRADTVLVALTGYGQERDRKLSADAGFDHHMVKPLKLNDLTALLDTLRVHPQRAVS